MVLLGVLPTGAPGCALGTSTPPRSPWGCFAVFAVCNPPETWGGVFYMHIRGCWCVFVARPYACVNGTGFVLGSLLVQFHFLCTSASRITLELVRVSWARHALVLYAGIVHACPPALDCP